MLLEVNWQGGTWTDESANLISASGQIGIAPIEDGLSGGGGSVASVATFVLNNSELANDNPGRYSPLNASSSLYTVLQSGKGFAIPIRFSAGYMNGAVAERVKMFTGYIFQCGDEYPATRMTWQCADESQKIRYQRVRTILYDDIDADEALGYLCDGVNLTAGNRDFDNALFKIPYWWADAEDTWDEMVKLATQDGGRLYFDHSGKLRFENLHHWLETDHRTSAWTFNVSNWRTLKPIAAPEDVWDGALVEFAPLQESYLQPVFEYQGLPFVVPANTTKTLQCQLQRPATGIVTPVGGELALNTDGEHDTDDNRDYVFVNSGGEEMNGSISIVLTSYAQHVDAAITNASTTYAASLTRFQLRGYPITGAQTGEVQHNSRLSAVSFPRIWEIRGNELIQTETQADALAQFLRDRKETPRLTYLLDNPYCAPQLELGDLVTVVGAYSNNSSAWTRTGYIVAINWNYSKEGGFSAQYTILDDANIFARFSVAEAFVIGTSKYGTGAGYGKVGY